MRGEKAKMLRVELSRGDCLITDARCCLESSVQHLFRKG